jgi:DNA-binding NarL/FixJ family response regulator
MSDPKLFEIAALAVEATTDPRKWADVCERLGERGRALLALVFEFDPATHAAPIFHMPAKLGAVGGFVEMFRSGASADEPRSYAAMARQEVGALLSEAELLGLRTDAEIPPNAFRDSYMPLLGAVTRAGAKLNDIGPHLDAMSFHFAHGSEDIAPNVRPDIALLGPVLGKALEAGRTFRALSHGFGLLLDAFDHLDCGAAICEPDGHYLIANRTFREMARDGDAISAHGGVVMAVMERKRAELARLIADAARADSPSRDLVLALDRRSASLPIVVKGAPIRSREIGAGKMRSLLLFMDPEDRDRLSVEGLAAFGLLTPAEVEVCGLLVQGWPSEEIALRRDTTPETTRNQIKSAMAKLLCASRLDLVRLALTTRAPIANRPPEG